MSPYIYANSHGEAYWIGQHFEVSGRLVTDGSTAMQVVVFRLDRGNFALPLASVDRVIRAVAVAPLPGAPNVILGAISVEGRHVPVLSLRRRLSFPDRELRASDQFILARLNGREVALLIDEISGVVEREPSAISDPAALAPGLERFDGVIDLEDGLGLIHDPEALLSLDEASDLKRATS
jgi:purine-binding chemotaxis protein CheW